MSSGMSTDQSQLDAFQDRLNRIENRKPNEAQAAAQPQPFEAGKTQAAKSQRKPVDDGLSAGAVGIGFLWGLLAVCLAPIAVFHLVPGADDVAGFIDGTADVPVWVFPAAIALTLIFGTIVFRLHRTLPMVGQALGIAVGGVSLAGTIFFAPDVTKQILSDDVAFASQVYKAEVRLMAALGELEDNLEAIIESGGEGDLPDLTGPTANIEAALSDLVAIPGVAEALTGAENEIMTAMLSRHAGEEGPALADMGLQTDGMFAVQQLTTLMRSSGLAVQEVTTP